MDNSQQAISNQQSDDVKKNEEIQLQKPIEEPENPVSGPAKEHAPLPPQNVAAEALESKSDIRPADPTEHAPEISAELREFISPTPDVEKPDLDREAQDAGIVHANNQSQPILSVTGSNVSLPEAIAVEKKSSIKTSLKWRAKEIIRQWKKILFLNGSKGGE